VSIVTNFTDGCIRNKVFYASLLINISFILCLLLSFGYFLKWSLVSFLKCCGNSYSALSFNIIFG